MRSVQLVVAGMGVVVCNALNVWNGSVFAAERVPTGVITAGTGIIPIGSSTCRVSVTHAVTNPVTGGNTAVTNTNPSL